MREMIALIVVLPILRFLNKLSIVYFASPEKAGRALLVREVRNRGVDTSPIPDAAWDELVKHSVSTAKLMAKVDKQASNWRKNLVSALEIEASFVASVLKGWGGQELQTTRETLLKHGINVPPLRE
jgi:hypothetical protein